MVTLDKEWVVLITAARSLGLSKEEIRNFISGQNKITHNKGEWGNEYHGESK